MENSVLVIRQEHIEKLQIQPSQCIEWARQAFLQKDGAQMPAKLSVHPQVEDFITTMPCLLAETGGSRYFGIKVVSRIEGQTPVLQSLVNLFDASTGRLLAVIDADWITAMRTGAVATLASRLLQRQGASAYSMMGLGNIARAVALCLIEDNKERPITIRLLRYKDQAELFMERFRHYPNVTFEVIDDRHDFVAGAEVLLSCVTVAKDLLFPDDSWFPEGLTLIPVHTKGFQNCDLFFDKVFGDDTGQLRGFRYFEQFRQYDELRHVLTGKNPGRTSAHERIISYNYGLALHDVFFAARIYELMQHQGAACTFELFKQKQKIWV